MEAMNWREFRENYPDLSRRIVALGSTVYAMGTDRAPESIEFGELVELIKNAPVKVRELFGFKDPIREEDVLYAIIEGGSSLLLDYVRTGTC